MLDPGLSCREYCADVCIWRDLKLGICCTQCLSRQHSCGVIGVRIARQGAINHVLCWEAGMLCV